MNIRYNIVVVTAEDNLSCHCDTQQDAHHEDLKVNFNPCMISLNSRMNTQRIRQRVAAYGDLVKNLN
jgi:hypothetical protein